MGNALTNLANSLFNSRQAQPVTDQGIRTAQINPNILGTGLANKAVSGALMREYQTRAAIAEANGEDFPSFEVWAAQRQ